MPKPRSRVEPVRTCVVCRSSAAKGTLHRIVRSPDGVVRYDPSGTAPGRGAYVCDGPKCLELAGKRRALQRALRMADAGPVEHAVEALRILRNRHEQGLVTTNEVLQAQTSLSQQKLSQVQTVFQFNTAQAYLQFLTSTSQK